MESSNTQDWPEAESQDPDGYGAGHVANNCLITDNGDPGEGYTEYNTNPRWPRTQNSMNSSV